MINTVCGIRSTGRICTDLATALEAQGHEVKIAYGRENVPSEYQKYAVRIGNEFDIRLHGAKARLFDGSGFGSRKTTRIFIKWIREYDPDVIHLHNIHGYYINIEELFNYLKTCGKKIIWTLHDCWAFTGHTAFCDSINCKKWINGCYKCPLKQLYPKTFVDHSKNNWNKKKELLRGVQGLTLITPSEWLKNCVLLSFLADYPVKVIKNGVDTSLFYPRRSSFKEKHNLTNKKIVLGVASVWDDSKGYSDFLRLSKVLEDDYQIVLVGLSKKQIQSLPNNIIGIERTTDVNELAEIYSAADVFLNMTYCDTFGQVNLEAALCGTPIISYDTGGCAESVGNSGVLVEKGNIKQVREKLFYIFSPQFKPDFNKSKLDSSLTIKKYLEEYAD